MKKLYAWWKEAGLTSLGVLAVGIAMFFTFDTPIFKHSALAISMWEFSRQNINAIIKLINGKLNS